MKIIIAGGSGQVGTVLSKHFHNKGFDVVVLSRSPKPSPWESIHWDGESLGPWSKKLENSDTIINLAGKSVN